MHFDPVTMDPMIPEGSDPGKKIHLKIGDPTILGILLIPHGDPPYPAAVLCHGFPGHDDNMDLAHMLTRAGFVSIVFHYRGSWGSGGAFSFTGMVDDIKKVIGHLRENHSEYGVDPEHMALIGYSMGGWAAMMAAADDPSIRHLAFIAGFNLGISWTYASLSEDNMRMMKETLSSSMPPLSGCSPEGLMKEIGENAQRFNLLHNASSIADRSILLVCGTGDETSLPNYHHDPIMTALRASGASDVEEVHIDAGHSFLGKRIELQRAIWKWLSKKVQISESVKSS